MSVKNISEAKLPVFPESHAKEFVALWNSLGNPAIQKQIQESGITLDQAKELLRNVQTEELKNYSIPEEQSSVVKNLLGLLDYGSGLVRTASMEGAAALSGQRGREAVAKNWKQDWSDALTPFEGRPAPSTQEWFTRMGLEKGKDLKTKLMQIPWNTMEIPKVVLGRGKFTTAPGPDLYDSAAFLGDAALSPGGIGLAGKGAKIMQAELPLGEKIMRMIKGKGPLPNQDLLNLTARETEAALAAKPTFNQKYTIPITKFAADPAAFVAPRLANKVFQGVHGEADRLSEAAGFGKVSDILSEQGMAGTPGTTYNDAKTYGKQVAKALTGVREDIKPFIPEFDLETSRKSVRAPVNDFLESKRPTYGDNVDNVKDLLWDRWAQTQPGKKILDINDLHDVKQSFQSLAREAGGYGNAPQNTGGMKPSMAFDSREQAKLTGQAASEQARLARQAEEALYDTFSEKSRDKFGLDDPTMMGSLYHLNNRKVGALLNAEPALLQRYRFSPTQQAFGGWGSRIAQEFWTNPTDWLRTNLGLYGSRYGGAAGMGARAGFVGRYAPEQRKDNPWKLMNINLSGAGDTSYDQ